MPASPLIQTGARQRRDRERRRRRRRRNALVALVGLLAFGLLAAATAERARGPGAASGGAAAAGQPPPPLGQTTLGPSPLHVDLRRPDRIRVPFKKPPRAGLLVNLDTGEVLWRRNAQRRLPIASLTKMMTALISVEELEPRDKARITKEVLRYSGSGVGVLPKGKRVRVETLLNGLMLPSGNDAARALALRTAGTQRAFVRRMNRRAAEWGLGCTRFASVEGLSDRNVSCPVDLAALARKVLDTPRLARIVRRRRAILPMPIKGGRVHMYNHNPLLRTGYPGVLGVKTGYTSKAGRCFVAAARRGGVRLAVVLLKSPDPGRQSRQLLNRGFRALRR
jgi:D-alanyl-D-alanine carboxypeptidase